MYPESTSMPEPPGEYFGGGGGIRNLLGYHLEALIPIILILVIGFFLAIKFGLITSSTPVVGVAADWLGGEKPAEMLIIGSSSPEVLDVLNASRDLVHYRMIVDATQLDRNPKDQLANYGIVMIDQSEQADKTISRRLGEAIENYVKAGGKLIVVKDSAIRRAGAYDIIGWEATLGDVVPVRCDRVISNIPTCLAPQAAMGEILRLDEDHRIVKGIERVPADPGQLILVETFDVTVTGNEIAYFQEAGYPRTYPAIVEKNLIIGKSIYFNYNPGTTRGILENTLRYLK